MNDVLHKPVMVEEVLSFFSSLKNLQDWSNICFFDWTLWHWWHTEAIITSFLEKKRSDQKLIVFWVDVDFSMLQKAKTRLLKYKDMLILKNDSYKNLDKISEMKKKSVDFFLLDLWVNMEHFKNYDRGFSINWDWILDMRYNLNQKKTAYQVINKYSVDKLKEIFILYADFTEKKSEEISRVIVKSRKHSDIKTTFELKKILNSVWLWEKASIVIFQAIRIEVNWELDNLMFFLESFYWYLKQWWRCLIITYHSLEDRIVKKYFKMMDWVNVLTKKVVKPNYKEVQKNRASRSAKIRVVEKI